MPLAFANAFAKLGNLHWFLSPRRCLASCTLTLSFAPALSFGPCIPHLAVCRLLPAIRESGS